MVSSSSATERIKLWSLYTGPVDQDTVKAQFLRKAHMKNPPFRIKIRSQPKERIQIPEMVEYHYKNRPSLLPSLRQVLRCEAVHSRGHSAETFHEDLSAKINGDLSAFRAAKISLNNVDDDLIEIESQKIEINLDDDEENSSITTVEPPTDTADVKPDINLSFPNKQLDVKDEVNQLDPSLVQALAVQRLQQIIYDNPEMVRKIQQQSTAIAIQEALIRQPTKNMMLPSELLSKDDVERISRMFSGVDAANPLTQTSQQLQNGFHDEHKRIKLEDDYYRNVIDDLQTEKEKVHEITVRLTEPIRQSKVRARAVLIPVTDILSGKR